MAGQKLKAEIREQNWLSKMNRPAEEVQGGSCKSTFFTRAWKEDDSLCRHIDAQSMSETDMLHLMNCRVVQ